MRIIAVLNQKGGVGKTTTAVNTAAALARLGKRTLAVDMDPQAHLTYSLGVMAHELERSVLDLMRGDAALEDLVLDCGGVDLVPSSMALSGAEFEFSSGSGGGGLVRSALNGLAGYDFVFLDCPPNLGVLTVNALATAGELLVPVQAEFLALQSLGSLMRTVETVKARINHGLALAGIVVTRYQKQKKLSREIHRKILEHFGPVLLSSVIRENVSLAEAPGFGQDIFRYSPRSNGALDYLNLGKELLMRGAQ